MIAYDLKRIVELAPEVAPLVKEAALAEDFPTGNKDSVCASYLRAEYLIHHKGQYVDPVLHSSLVKAAYLYQVKDALDEVVKKFSKPELQKSAQEDLLEKIALFEEYAYSFHQPEKAAELAQHLVSHTDREDVKKYAGKAFLDKEASVAALARRYQTCKSTQYVKMAHLIVDKVTENDFTKVAEVCKMVTELDKINGLDVLGFDFYKEALQTKVAALVEKVTVNLAGKEVPYSAISRLGKKGIADLVGEDIASGVNENDPFATKQALEASPRDVQLILRKVCA